MFQSLAEYVCRYIWKSTTSFPEAVECQGTVITSGHHLPCGGERLAVRINVLDLFQPMTDFFSTRALISVHSKTVRNFSQSIFSLFSYFKNA